MIIVNFGHPLGDAQLAALRELLPNEQVNGIKEVRCQVDQEQSFADQAAALVEQVGFTPTDWQHTPFVVVPPGLAPLACALLACIHGRCGYFPVVVRLKPRAGSAPPVFVPAEVLDLAKLREQSRALR
jgi:hypothetical protein